jgi:hypothetical protein
LKRKKPVRLMIATKKSKKAETCFRQPTIEKVCLEEFSESKVLGLKSHQPVMRMGKSTTERRDPELPIIGIM